MRVYPICMKKGRGLQETSTCWRMKIDAYRCEIDFYDVLNKKSMSTLESDVLKLLEGKSFASFVTLLNNGSPHVSPIWIDHEGEIILVNTAMGRLKEKKCEKRPTCCHFNL